MIGFGCDILFRFGFLAFSVFQLALVGSDGVNHCATKKKLLGEDASWMRSLAITQLVMIPIFLLWRHFSVL